MNPFGLVCTIEHNGEKYEIYNNFPTLFIKRINSIVPGIFKDEILTKHFSDLLVNKYNYIEEINSYHSGYLRAIKTYEKLITLL